MAPRRVCAEDGIEPASGISEDEQSRPPVRLYGNFTTTVIGKYIVLLEID